MPSSMYMGFSQAGTPGSFFNQTSEDASSVRRNGGFGGFAGPAGPVAGETTDANQNLLNSRLNWGANNGTATLAPPPRIDAGPIWNSQQIQQRVNSMRASNDQSAASRTQSTNQNLAAKGFGANSPLAQALGAQYAGQALGANTQGENDIRWNAAQGNAQQVLAGQLGQSNQWNQQNEQAIRNKQMQLNNQYTLLNMLQGQV